MRQDECVWFCPAEHEGNARAVSSTGAMTMARCLYGYFKTTAASSTTHLHVKFFTVVLGISALAKESPHLPMSELCGL